MGYVVGIGLALGVFWFARWTGFARERAFYPTILIVVASLAPAPQERGAAPGSSAS